MPGPESRDTRRTAGFSLLELVMSLVVLTFGVAGLATTSLFITRQLTLAEVTTARAAATRSAMERIRSTPFDSISSGGDTTANMKVTWTVTSTTPQTTTLDIVTLGPGLASMSPGRSTPMLSSSVEDTLVYMVLRP